MRTHRWRRSRSSSSQATRDRNRPRRPRRLSVESLEGRCLPSADVVLQWNKAVLQAIRNDKPTIGFVTRDLAIVHTAIYDAVSAIDPTSTPFHVRAGIPGRPSKQEIVS